MGRILDALSRYWPLGGRPTRPLPAPPPRKIRGFERSLTSAMAKGDLSAVVALVRAQEARKARKMPNAQTEVWRGIVDRQIGVRLRWTAADRERILEQCETGDLYALGLFLDAMRANGTVWGIMSTRETMLRLPAIWTGDPLLVEWLRGKAPVFDEPTGAMLDPGHESDFQRLFPITELGAVHWDGDLGGLGIGEFVPAEDGQPRLRHLDVHGLRYDWTLRRFTYTTTFDTYEVRPGDGRWFLYAPYGLERPWSRAPWLPCALPVIADHQAVLDRLRWQQDLADALKYMKLEKDRPDEDLIEAEEFMRDRWHRSPYLAMRVGEEAGLVESTGKGYEVYGDGEDSSDKKISKTLAGQSATSGDGSGGLGQKGTIWGDIAESIVATSAEKLAETIHEQGLKPYARARGRRALVWMRWDVRSPERKAADAEALGKYSEGVEKADAMLKSRGKRLHLDQYGESQGFELPTEDLQESDAPRVDLTLAPTSLDTIVTLKDAARSKGLPPPPGVDPNMTISQRKAELDAQPAQAAALDEITIYETRLVHGLPVVIDRPAGTIQRGLGPDGPWEREYLVDYGYVDGTAAPDGEGVDVYLGPQDESPTAWIVEQRRQDGSADEHKILLNFATRELAIGTYLLHVPPWCLGPISELPAVDVPALLLRWQAALTPANDTAA